MTAPAAASSSRDAGAPPRHAWSQATDGGYAALGLGSKTAISDVADDGDGSAPSSAAAAAAAVAPYEADVIVSSLRSFSVEEVGGSDFMRACGYDLQRLSSAAHASAASRAGDEYVVEALLIHGKLEGLVRTLLAVEAWRTEVLFLRGRGDGDGEGSGGGGGGGGLASRLASHGNALRAAFALHVEATVVGLLNLALYRREGAMELTCEAAIALVDYCARSMTALAAPVSQSPMLRRQKEPPPPSSSSAAAADLARRLRSRTSLDEIRDARLESEYKACVAAVAAARYLCEHFELLPLGAQARMMDAHDFPALAAALIEEPPWTRRRAVAAASAVAGGEGGGGSAPPAGVAWEKFVSNEWIEVPPADLLRLTPCEAQPWLALYHLTCSDACRERYGLDSFRKSRLLRVRKYLNETVLDQLPVLAEVMRYMDQLALMAVPDSAVAGRGSALLMEQVDTLREEVVGGRDWDEVGRTQFEEIFSKVTDATDRDLHRISEVYCADEFDDAAGGGRPGPSPEPTSRPVDGASLTVFAGGADGSAGDGGGPAAVASFLLEPAEVEGGGGGTAVPTERGLFARIEMAVRRSDGDDGEGGAPFPVPSDGRAVAVISFRGRPPLSAELSLPDLNLPALDAEDGGAGAGAGGGEEDAEVPRSLSSREWRQLGKLEEGAVLQLGFRRLPRTRAAELDGRRGGGGGGGDDAKKKKKRGAACCYGLDRAFLSKPVDELE